MLSSLLVNFLALNIHINMLGYLKFWNILVFERHQYISFLFHFSAFRLDQWGFFKRNFVLHFEFINLHYQAIVLTIFLIVGRLIMTNLYNIVCKNIIFNFFARVISIYIWLIVNIVFWKAVYHFYAILDDDLLFWKTKFKLLLFETLWCSFRIALIFFLIFHNFTLNITLLLFLVGLFKDYHYLIRVFSM